MRGESNTALRDLHTRILCSKDRLFLVRYKAAGEDTYGWNLVKVDIDKSDQERALKLGEYQCKFYIRHHRDSVTMKQNE